jgi:hypothetical protein
VLRLMVTLPTYDLWPVLFVIFAIMELEGKTGA